MLLSCQNINVGFVPVLVFFASSIQLIAQTKETPTVEQCRADASHWTVLPIRYKDWSVEAINSALKEMLFCDINYQNDSAHPQFAQLQHQLQDEIADRYQHFIGRHGLFVRGSVKTYADFLPALIFLQRLALGHCDAGPARCAHLPLRLDLAIARNPAPKAGKHLPCMLQ
jgi:hypothetical protein